MADEKALPPAEGDQQNDDGSPDETLEVKAPKPGEQSETTRLERRKKLSLRQDGAGDTGEVEAPGETIETPAPAETQGAVLQDPTRRRDTNTASLKRLRPQDLSSDDSGDVTEDDPDNTETVNIKVIKEQKKQFRNMMTSSQTLKVNEDGSPAEGPAAGASVQAEETRTEAITRPGSDPNATAEEPAPVANQSPKSTLKIKAPPGVAPAQGGGAARPGATLKIKAPAPASDGGKADPSARTVKRTVAGRPGKTLKLRQTPQPQRDPASGTRAAPRPVQPQPVADEGGAPGVVYILFSAASVVFLGLVLWKTIDSSNILFDGAVFPWM